MAERLPGKGLLGWLGRQIGYVRRALRTDVTARPVAQHVIYRDGSVQEAPMPGRPDVMLRRTTVDEVILTTTKTTKESCP